jgi:hypothetical protein
MNEWNNGMALNLNDIIYTDLSPFYQAPQVKSNGFIFMVIIIYAVDVTAMKVQYLQCER